MKTETLYFIGSNERSNPVMPLRHVQDDLELLTDIADSMVVQEFKVRGYWRRAANLFSRAWGASPGWAAGIARPVAGGQPVFWRRDTFRRRRSIARLMHEGVAGISEMRMVRRVQLEHRATGLRVWHVNGHCVVGADEAGDGRIRQEMLYEQDLPALDHALTKCRRTGHPVIGHIDGNIHKDSAAYSELMKLFARHRARVIGEHGVEYLFIVDGRHTVVDVRRHDIIRPKHRGGRLWTDHEARLISYQLRQV